MVSKVHGRFAKWSGSLAFDDKAPEASRLSVEIDAASVDTREQQRDGHLKSADFLDVEKFPTITFKSKRVERTSQGHFKVAGDLTVHGVAKEAVLDVEETGRGKDPWGNSRVGFVGKTSIHRADWGLKWNQALETGGVLVGEKVDIEIEIEAIQAKA